MLLQFLVPWKYTVNRNLIILLLQGDRKETGGSRKLKKLIFSKQTLLLHNSQR